MMASILLLLPMTMAGVNDTVDQLRNGFTIVPLSDEVDSKSRKLSLQCCILLSSPAFFSKAPLNWLSKITIHEQSLTI